MDINQSCPSDSCNSSNATVPATSKQPPAESSERKSSSSCNGDSGYHSDLSGYHKGGESLKVTAEKSAETSEKDIELSNNLSDGTENHFSSSSRSASRLCNGTGHLEMQDAESPETKLKVSETIGSDSSKCKAVKHCDSYLINTSIQNNGAVQSRSSCVSSHTNQGVFSAYDSHFDGTPASSSPGASCIQHDCSLQESQQFLSKAASSPCLPRKSVETLQSNDDFKTLLQDLALKIEFCLVFGYTASQIKAAITKLSYKASKNDILAELSSIQSGSAIPPTTLSMITSFESSHINSVGGEISKGNSGEIISRGAEFSQDPDLQARGPLSVDNQSKDGNNEMCMVDESENLRPVVIDGSNVAMSHGNKQYFSCKGILLAVDYFRNRNHRDITVFVPNYRKESPRSDAPIKDRQILDKLEEERILVYTPSRHIKGKRVTCYDDRFILRLAEDTEGIIVSNDHFRDLQNEKAEWKELVEKRLLMYSFASDRFMPPDDPLGRNGPNINNFLRKRPMAEEQSKQPCPYGKKCTYGKKCKFFHPECARPVSERMKENSERRLRASNESIELAVELMKANNVHNSSLSGTARDKMYNQVPLIHCGSSQLHDSKSLYNGRKVDNARNRRVPSSVHDDQMYALSNGRVNHVPAAGDNAYTQQYQSNGSAIPDDFRRMSLSNNYAVKSNSHLSHTHSNGQVSYEAHCQNYPGVNDPPRAHYSPNSYPARENAPLDFHKNSVMNQQYQQTSPPTLPMYERNNGANSMLQRQQINPTSPYPSVPGFQSAYPTPSHPVYPSGYTEPPYHANQRILCSYNVNGHSQGSAGVHPGMLPSSSYYVTPINSSTGSNSSSMSHSYPFVTLEKAVVPQSLSHRNLSNSSAGSEPKTYPPRAPRGYSSPNPQQHMRQTPYNSNSLISNGQSMNPASHIPPSGEPPLSNVNNPRHYLYRNLCSLFQRHIVEAVMNAHPEVREPKLLVKMCLDSD